MNNKLGYLPENKQDEIDAIVRILTTKAPVEMLVLFGSHARGDWVSDVYQEGTTLYDYKSDYDLLVVVESDEIKDNLVLWRDIEKELTTVTKLSVSLIIDSINFVNKKISESNYFYLDIKNEGIVLYDSEKFKLNTPEPRSRDMMKTDYEFWFGKAKSFYKDYKHNMTDGELNNAAFHLSQVTESLYFAVLLVFIGYKPKSHNISKIAELAQKLAPELADTFLEDTEEHQRVFDLLKKAYIDARYKQDYKITTDQLDYLAGCVDTLFERVEKVCIEQVQRGTNVAHAPKV